MAESDKTNSLSEDYLLKDIEEKLNVGTEPGDKSAEKDAVTADPVESPAATDSVESSDNSAVSESVTASADSSQGSDAAAEENVVETDSSDKDVPVPPPAATEESSENAEEGNIDEEKPEIKLETAPGDYRFPTTNQSRHCFTRYVEYHRCVAAKGEDASECDKFAKYYRSLCPGEWV
ncbi:cytochrome c oxidase, subunit VIb [Cynara cardunculus var. scolymus]|uniref:Cytochrome c oxidase, subunit VIb n=2 Tax=Cynara cardunculus var. scolymus TaxID=59895 RepID=A0A118JZE3_CYNCS|nr:cytochrome c oxidase, subunit VIb [Cynara cardunculus var. scolymus]